MKFWSSWPLLQGESCSTKHNTLTWWMWNSPKLFLAGCLQPAQAPLRSLHLETQTRQLPADMESLRTHRLFIFPQWTALWLWGCLGEPRCISTIKQPYWWSPCCSAKGWATAEGDVCFGISVVLWKTNTYHDKGSSHFAAGFLSYCALCLYQVPAGFLSTDAVGFSASLNVLTSISQWGYA